MEQIWWGRVPNAIALSSDIIQQLLAERSIVLHYSSGFPWHDYFVQYIKEAVRQQNSSKRFEIIRNVDDPGSYLLKNYCKAEKRAQYRPFKSYAKFFAESDDIVLHDRYFWVSVDSDEILTSWQIFISDYVKYRAKGKEQAAFIVEWKGDKNIRPWKGIRVISIDDYVGEYDRIVFATLASSSIKSESFLKEYITELTATVAGNDIELAAKCIEEYHDFLQDPFQCISRIVSGQFRSDGNGYVFEKTKEEVDKCIWMSQIKTIYPLIEKFRGEFVTRHWAAIKKELPITSSYGETYDSPEDVELGTLVYMAGIGRLQLSQTEYNRLDKYKNARNCLSHLNILTFEEMKALNL